MCYEALRLDNDKLESIFRSKLTAEEIDRRKYLRSRQEGYLNDTPICFGAEKLLKDYNLLEIIHN